MKSTANISIAILALPVLLVSLPAAGHADTLEAAAASEATNATPRAYKAPPRQAILTVAPRRATGRIVYTATISNFVGFTYIKYWAVGGSWRWWTQSVDQSFAVTSPKPLTRLIVRAQGYKPLNFAVPRRPLRLALKSDGRALPWEGDGKPAMHKFLRVLDSGPVRFDPCAYTYSGDDGRVEVLTATRRSTLKWRLKKGEWAIPLVQEAIQKISAASGWNFQRVTTGDELTVEVDRQAAPLQINGYGGFSYDDVAIRDGHLEVHLGANTPRAMRVRLIMHEIGHAMGLDHVNSQTQMMYPIIPWAGEARVAAGDRAGLRRVGSTQKCFFKVGDLRYLFKPSTRSAGDTHQHLAPPRHRVGLR